MRKLIYYVGTSLDGFIAGPAGEIDFLPVSDEFLGWITDRYPETLPTHIRLAIGIDARPNAEFDTVVMGRATFEPALTIPTTRPYAHLREYVVSTTITIDDPDVEVVCDDPTALIRSLKAEPSDSHIWLAGGGTLAASLLPEIDGLVIKSYPVIAGSGIPMFAGEFDPAAFTVTDREHFENGTTVSWFDRR